MALSDGLTGSIPGNAQCARCCAYKCIQYETFGPAYSFYVCPLWSSFLLGMSFCCLAYKQWSSQLIKAMVKSFTTIYCLQVWCLSMALNLHRKLVTEISHRAIISQLQSRMDIWTPVTMLHSWLPSKQSFKMRKYPSTWPTMVSPDSQHPNYLRL